MCTVQRRRPLGRRGPGSRRCVRHIIFGFLPNNAYLCGPSNCGGIATFYVKPLIIKTVDTLSYKTVSLNKATVNKEWLVIDATDLVLGRLASRVALVLRGKNKPGYTPHVDCGDNVIIVNAEKIRLTGKKMTDRVYVRYTGYPGGQRFSTPREILAKRPAELIRRSVKGMLPKTRLGDKLINNLYVYAGPEHPHQAQNPKTIKFNEI